MVLSTISVILRFVSRGVSKTPLWWDDYTVLIALVSAGLLLDLSESDN